MPVIYKECRFCDSQRSVVIDGERVCSPCGAEWDPIDVVYSDAEIKAIEKELRQMELEREHDDDHLLIDDRSDMEDDEDNVDWSEEETQ